MKWLMKKLLPIIVWIAVSEILIWVTPTPQYPIKPEFFSICVMQDNQPELISLDKHKPNQVLCAETHFQAANYPLRFDLKYISQDNMWELTTSNDSLSDPHIYLYRIENQKVTPLKHTYGGMMIRMTSYMTGAVLAAIIWALIKFILNKKRKQVT